VLLRSEQFLQELHKAMELTYSLAWSCQVNWFPKALNPFTAIKSSISTVISFLNLLSSEKPAPPDGNLLIQFQLWIWMLRYNKLFFIFGFNQAFDVIPFFFTIIINEKLVLGTHFLTLPYRIKMVDNSGVITFVSLIVE
jgi:hypothetical protein